MKLVAIYLLSLILFLFTFQKAESSIQLIGPKKTNSNQFNTEYYGADHNEAEFNLIGLVTVIQTKEPTRENVEPLIRSQMRYMLGLMRSREVNAAALYPKWNFSTLSVKQTSVGKWLIKYNLKAKGAFASGLTQYTFTLPYNPLTIFKDSQGQCMAKEAEESNFWYHWEPLISGCPLIENVNYYTYTAQLTPITNTVSTYPEYEKLVDGNKTIKMTMFFGFENYDFPNWNPDGGEDWGIRGYNMQRDFLKSLGYTETTWTTEQIQKIYIARDSFVPYVLEFNKPGKVADIRIRLVLLDTGYSHNSTAFHTFLKESLANESVVVYNGHSGIGKNLDLASIEKLRGFKLPLNPLYQILFLGSCVPYSYYTDMFFNRKKTTQDLNGTLKLDILSYGKESIFGNQEDTTLTRAVTLYAQNGQRTTYQNMVRSSPNYFYGISGDEDNPQK